MKKIVVYSGAGISAESGLKTFRDSDGLWKITVSKKLQRLKPGMQTSAVLEILIMRGEKQVLEARPNAASFGARRSRKKESLCPYRTQNI